MRNGVEGETGKSAGLLAVPSFSTLQSLRKSIMENGNTCPLTQKHLVQLDWVSKEDGSHILTVAVGSRVLLFTAVSSDLAQANLKVRTMLICGRYLVIDSLAAWKLSA